MVLFQALNAYFHLWPIVSHPTNLSINMQICLASCIIVCQHIFKKQFLSLLINWLLLNVPSEFCQSVCLSCHQIVKKALLIYPLRKRQLLSEGFFFVLAPSVTRDLIKTNFQSIHRKPTNSSTKKILNSRLLQKIIAMTAFISLETNPTFSLVPYCLLGFFLLRRLKRNVVYIFKAN